MAGRYGLHSGKGTFNELEVKKDSVFQGDVTFNGETNISGGGLSVSVAAVDSSARSIAAADYICDGTNDEIQIQAAIDSVIATGGKVQLSSGTFNIADTIILHGTPNSGEGVHLAGDGMGLTSLKAVANTTTAVLEWSPSIDEFFVQLTDFSINGNKGNGATGDSIFVTDADGGAPNDMQMHNLFVINAGNVGFNIQASWGFRIINCIAEFCGAAGLSINGSQNYIAYCFFAYNNATTGVYSVELKNNITAFLGNSVYDNGGNANGLRCWGSLYSSITGNTFRGFKTGNPALYVSGLCTGTVICNNSLTGNEYGMRVKSDVAGALITSNNFAENTLDVTIESGNKASIFDNMSDKPFEESKLEAVTNTSGGELARGDLIVLKDVASGTEITTTTSAGDDKVYGMVNEVISNTVVGKILIRGKTNLLKVDGTVDISIGDFICTSTAVGIGIKAGTGDMAIAIAHEAYTTDDANGVIDATIITPRKI